MWMSLTCLWFIDFFVAVMDCVILIGDMFLIDVVIEIDLMFLFWKIVFFSSLCGLLIQVILIEFLDVRK